MYSWRPKYIYKEKKFNENSRPVPVSKKKNSMKKKKSMKTAGTNTTTSRAQEQT
jgi:hypothetical protein